MLAQRGWIYDLLVVNLAISYQGALLQVDSGEKATWTHIYTLFIYSVPAVKILE
jgi:hypothetical protein